MKRLIGRILLCAALVGAGVAIAATPNAFVVAPTTQPAGSGVGQIYSSFAPIAPVYTDALVLSGNAAQTQAVPSSSRIVIFSSTCNFYAKTGASVAVPGSTTTDGTAAQLNPGQWSLDSTVTQITVIAGTSCVVTVTFYK